MVLLEKEISISIQYGDADFQQDLAPALGAKLLATGFYSVRTNCVYRSVCVCLYCSSSLGSRIIYSIHISINTTLFLGLSEENVNSESHNLDIHCFHRQGREEKCVT